MAKHKPVTFTAKTGGNYDLMAAALAGSENQFKAGKIVKGTILAIRGNEVLVDIGYKSEGIIPAAEFKKSDDIKPGDELDVLLEGIENEEGMVMLSREKAVQKMRWDNVLQTCKEGGTIMGAVVSRVSPGPR